MLEICGLFPDPGPCSEGYKRYYYDSERGQCIPFVYGGCGGNLNRFKTYDTCRGYCSGSGNSAVASASAGGLRPTRLAQDDPANEDDEPAVGVACELKCLHKAQATALYTV